MGTPVLLASCPGRWALRIDSEDLRHHYASLADEELGAIDTDDLTEAARAVYDAELGRRGLKIRSEEEGSSESSAGTSSLGRQGEVDETATDLENPDAPGEFDIDVGPPPDWLEDAACACSFVSRPNDRVFPVLPQAARARLALRNAGIPCRITLQKDRDEDDPPAADPAAPSLVCVMVPGGLALHATSVLDRDMFNEEKEESWRNNFEELSDSELQALDPEIFCAGYLDLVARLRRVYGDEITRRQLRTREAGAE
jgi:hypothetical protein